MADSEQGAREFDVDAAIQRNHKVDEAQLREARRLVEELRAEGVIRPAYRLASPYGRQPGGRPRHASNRRFG